MKPRAQNDAYSYRAYGFEIVLRRRSLTVRAIESSTSGIYQRGRWAVFLALLAIRRTSAQSTFLPAETLREYSPWSRAQSRSVGQRVRRQLLEWKSAGIQLVEHHGITKSWRLSDTTNVKWQGISIDQVEAQLNSPGLGEWSGGTDELRFAYWLRAMVKATVENSRGRVEFSIRQLERARLLGPTLASRAAAALELSVLTHARSGLTKERALELLQEFEQADGPIARAVRLQRFNLALLDSGTESGARLLLHEIESTLRVGSTDVGAGTRSSLLASAALAWRRSQVFGSARACASAAATAGFAVRDLRAVYRATGELLLAYYQDALIRRDSAILWTVLFAALRLERAMPVLRDSMVTPLIAVRMLTFRGRLRWARRLYRTVARELGERPRDTDSALAAVCHATLTYAEASKHHRRSRAASWVRDHANVRDAYKRASELHHQIARSASWFEEELDAFERGIPFRTSNRS